MIYVSPRRRVEGMEGVVSLEHLGADPGLPWIPGSGCPAASRYQKGEFRSGKYPVPAMRLCVAVTAFFAELTYRLVRGLNVIVS
jgi:hypothetical protein